MFCRGFCYTLYMIVVVMAVLGLIAGSFINAVVWRLHSGESIARGRSMCPNCRHRLAWFDLIPVASWLWLHGRCRYCKAGYGVHYVVVEVLTAGLFALSGYLLLGLGSITLAIWLTLVVHLLILALYDAQWHLLPDRVMHPALVLASVYYVLCFEPTRGLLQLFAALVCSAVFYGLWRLSDGKLMGGADSKLVLLMGLVLPAPLLGVALAMAFMTGGLGAAYLLYDRHKDLGDHMPFGPYLIAGLLIAQFWGNAILRLLGF